MFCGLLLAAAGGLHGQQSTSDSAEIGRMVRDASRAIQAGNAASFLSYFDKDEFADYVALREGVVALSSQRQIASSIEIREIESHGDSYVVGISWLLQLTLTGDPGPVETRQEAVSCSVKKLARGWKIVQFEPVSLFRP